MALYCFDENVEFYKKLGFIKGPPFGRLRREAKQFSHRSPDINFHTTLPLSAILTLDREAFGADRSRLIRDMLRSRVARVLSIVRGEARAYLFVKDYEDMCELGPWVSVRVRSRKLNLMLRQSLTTARGKSVEISAPLSNVRILRMLNRHGFRVVRTGRSMYFDEVPTIGSSAAVLALGFLDKG